jgi:lambda family phage tail tape measure protein
MEQMEEKKRTLFDLNEQDLMLLRITTGSYKDFDSDTKVRLLNMALEIDERHNLIASMESELERIKALDAGRERGNEIFKEFLLTGRDATDQRAHDLELLGKTAREQEVLNALHEIDVRLLQAKRAASAAYGEDFDGAQKEIKRLETEAMRQREQVIGQIKQRQEVERAWATGAKQAFGDYADAATNSAAAAQMLFTDAFKGAEDALVDFVKSGKFNFSSLADSIITDLTRIAVRQAVLGPLAQALFGGGGGAGIWASFAANTNNFGAGFGAGADTLGVGAAPYAAGGYTARGAVRLVGERGPELFVPDVGGKIISNSALARMGGSQGIYMPITIQTPDPGSFRASSMQVASDIASGVRRGRLN